ncbi:MAG: S1 RNA-binding domain-containing protein [Anaerolineales bacterium]|jgi:ribosomal protein S1
MDANTTTGALSSIKEIKNKMYFRGKVVKTTLAGALVDIGIDTPGMVHISQLQKSTVKRVEDVIHEGDEVDVWVRRVSPKKGRIELTMIKPLGLEWGEIKKDMVVTGKVIRLEKFGAFVDIGAERPGLVHISEMTHDFIRTPGDVVKEGDDVEVKVLDVIKPKKQIKLSMKALQDKPEEIIKTTIEKNDKREQHAREQHKEIEPKEEVKEAPIPTAMEAALREAMGRKGVDNVNVLSEKKKKRKTPETNPELETIYTRTLKTRSPK